MKKILLLFVLLASTVGSYASAYPDAAFYSNLQDGILYGLGEISIYIGAFIAIMWIGLAFKLWKACDQIGEILKEIKREKNS